MEAALPAVLCQIAGLAGPVTRTGAAHRIGAQAGLALTIPAAGGTKGLSCPAGRRFVAEVAGDTMLVLGALGVARVVSAAVGPAELYAGIPADTVAAAVVCHVQDVARTRLGNTDRVGKPLSAGSLAVALSIQGAGGRRQLLALVQRIGAGAGVLAGPEAVADAAQATFRLGIRVHEVVLALSGTARNVAGSAGSPAGRVAAHAIGTEPGGTPVGRQARPPVGSFGHAAGCRAVVPGGAVAVCAAVGATDRAFTHVRSAGYGARVSTLPGLVTDVRWMVDAGGTAGRAARRSRDPRSTGTKAVAQTIETAGCFLLAVVCRIGAGKGISAGSKAIADHAHGTVVVRVRVRGVHGAGSLGPFPVARTAGFVAGHGAAPRVTIVGFLAQFANAAPTIPGAFQAVLLRVAAAVPAPGNVEACSLAADVVLRAFPAASPAAVRAALTIRARGEGADAGDTGVPAASTRAVGGAGDTILSVRDVARSVAAARPAVGRTGIAGFEVVADVVSAPGGVCADAFVALEEGKALPAGAPTAVTSAFPLMAGHEQALAPHALLSTAAEAVPRTPSTALPEVGFAEVISAAEPAVFRAVEAVLGGVAMEVPAPGNVDALALLAFVVDVADAAGHTAAIIATLPPLAGRVGACTLQTSMAAGTQAVLAARRAVLDGITGSVSAPGDIHALPRLTLLVNRTVSAGTPAATFTTLQPGAGKTAVRRAGAFGLLCTAHRVSTNELAHLFEATSAVALTVVTDVSAGAAADRLGSPPARFQNAAACASPAVLGARTRGFSSTQLADPVAAARPAIRRTGLAGLSQGAGTIPASRVAIGGAGTWRFMRTAQAVPAGSAVHWAAGRAFPAFADAIAAGCVAVHRAVRSGLQRAADAVPASATVDEARNLAFAVPTQTVAATGHTVGGAAFSVGARLVGAADTIPARAAVHGTEFGMTEGAAFESRTHSITTNLLAQRIDPNPVTDSVLAGLIEGARVTVVAGSSIVARRVSAFPVHAQVQGARVAVVGTGLHQIVGLTASGTAAPGTRALVPLGTQVVTVRDSVAVVVFPVAGFGRGNTGRAVRQPLR